MSADVTFVVHGKPVTQGTIRSLGAGRPSIYGNKETLIPWRENVRAKAVIAMALTDRLLGPARCDLAFFFDRPASAPKRRRTWPITRGSGDLDKLIRACFDAMTDGGVWKDDSQVVEVRARKCWTGIEWGLQVPGVLIRVWRVEE